MQNIKKTQLLHRLWWFQSENESISQQKNNCNKGSKYEKSLQITGIFIWREKGE